MNSEPRPTSANGTGGPNRVEGAGPAFTSLTCRSPTRAAYFAMNSAGLSPATFTQPQSSSMVTRPGSVRAKELVEGGHAAELGGNLMWWLW